LDVDRGINTAIRRIREALRDDPARPRFIETVVGKGCRFIAEVEEARPGGGPVAPPAKAEIETELEAPEQTPAAAGTAEITAAAEQETGRPRTKASRRLWLIASALLLVLAISLAGWQLSKRPAANGNGSLQQVTFNDTEQRVTAAAISPDGKWIAYADTRSVVLRILQNRTTVVLNGPPNVRAERIAWFPGQTRILLSGSNIQTARQRIWTVSITGGSPRLFLDNARNGVPSPDGTRVLFTTNKDRELWTAGPAGEGSRPLIADSSGRAFSAVFWSRDGKRVCYLRQMNFGGKEDYYESVDAVSGKVLATERNTTFDSAYALEDGRVFLLRDSAENFLDAYSLWVVKTNVATGAFMSPPPADCGARPWQGNRNERRGRREQTLPRGCEGSAACIRRHFTSTGADPDRRAETDLRHASRLSAQLAA
jgi:hypothetical protein